MIERTLQPALLEAASRAPAVAVTGPRQSGKTTLCRACFPDHDYVSLEPLDVREFALTDPRGFLRQHAAPVILDEVQRAPDLFSYLQEAVDAEPTSGGFILTGSQHFGLTASISQSLAGRVALLDLLPLSLEEVRRFDSAPTDLWPTVWSGGYPRIHDRGLVPNTWLADYVATYVQRDVRQVVNVTDLDAFGAFLRLAAGRTGQELSLSSLGADVGVTHNTVRAWVSVLEASFVVFKLPPWVSNTRKRVIKAPKLHFVDSGLACHLLGIRSPDQLAVHPLRGAVFESWVAAEVRKAFAHRRMPPDLFHLRETRGIEVDLIAESGDRVYGVEVKSGATVPRDVPAALNDWPRSELEGRAAVRRLVYGGDRRQEGSTVDVSRKDPLSEASARREGGAGLVTGRPSSLGEPGPHGGGRMGRRAATAVLTVAWLSLAGCGGPDATESEVTVVDSAGVRIVEHPLGPAPATWTPHEDQVVQLADDPATPLFEIGAALRTADGYVVADGGNYRLVFYDPDGAVRFALGREGEGPGEYRHLTLLARGVADSLLVWDRSVRRGTILSPAGDFERAFTLQTRDSVRVANVSSVYEDGSLLATGFVSLGGGPPEQGRQIYATDWYHYDAAGGFIATVRTLPATETYFDVRDSGGFLVAPVLFANRSYHLAAGMRSLAAQSYQYEVRFLTPSGTLTTIVRRTPRARPLTEDARAAETERLLSEGRSDNEQLRIVLETMEVPAQLPELAGLFVDRLQRVWVEEFDDPAERPALATWRVYGPDGLLLGAISLPRDFRLTDAGDGFVLGVATDGLGQQSVLELGFGS